VLEDEPLIALMLEDWLSELGHEPVGPAQTIAEALKLCESEPFDAAILDLSIGADSSYAVADALLARKVPFAFATGHGASTLEEGYAQTLVVSKPFDFEAVRAAIGRLLGPVT
jgi:CheY-like chemotaxis protein